MRTSSVQDVLKLFFFSITVISGLNDFRKYT